MCHLFVRMNAIYLLHHHTSPSTRNGVATLSTATTPRVAIFSLSSPPINIRVLGYYLRLLLAQSFVLIADLLLVLCPALKSFFIMAEEHKHHHLFHHHKDDDDGGGIENKQYEEKHAKKHEHMGELGALGAGGFAMYERHEVKKDPEHAHKHKIEEEIAAAAAVGGGGYAFHEHHEKKEAKKEEEEYEGKKHHFF